LPLKGAAIGPDDETAKAEDAAIGPVAIGLAAIAPVETVQVATAQEAIVGHADLARTRFPNAHARSDSVRVGHIATQCLNKFQQSSGQSLSKF